MQNKFPLWKYVLLVLIAVLGFVYALPNLYSEDPSIQISGAKDNYTQLESKIDDTLKKANIPVKGISKDESTLLVRFKTTDEQLKARDLIKAMLGNNYTVALNLTPTTPKWLNFMGAEPMKQGLDLRGGIHFLLEVDVNSVLTRRLEGTLKNIAQELREERIRYTGLSLGKKSELKIRFRTAKGLDDASILIKQKQQDLLQVKNEVSKELILKLMPSELNNIRQNTIEQTMSILRNRVNELGVGEAVVQQQGATRVAVDLPGIQDAARAKQILGGTATLEFHLVDEGHDAQIASQTGVVPIGTKLYDMNGRPLLLKRQVVLSGDSITSAVSGFDQQTATPSVNIQLGGGGESLFTRVTRENIGKRLAIVFVETKVTSKLIDGKIVRQSKKSERVISAAVIQSALGTHFQITGLTSSKESKDLSLLLRAGALPAAIYPVEERTVGPSLGKENVERGIVSLEVGMLLILLAMVIYYRLFGLIANIALFLNLILLVALLSIIDATLTLPGIAGIVLTVGMAVDANVLIYERIREELRHGFSPQAAIYAGYEKAFSTIIDANVTTLIVAVVLFAVGTGAVKGFAVTLSIGLVTSMLTGITFTRAMVNLIYGSRHVKRLSIGI
jgi:preprotein translocase subunit SecD